MSHEESISLEETNKLRISLGLKPLTDDKAPVDSAEKRAEDNYTRQREKEAQDREKKYDYTLPKLTTSLTCVVCFAFQKDPGSNSQVSTLSAPRLLNGHFYPGLFHATPVIKPWPQELFDLTCHLRRVRNRRELNTGLKGATLGDADDDADDTKSWLKKNKKKEKELAAKRLKEIESMDDAAQGEYSESA